MDTQLSSPVWLPTALPTTCHVNLGLPSSEQSITIGKPSIIPPIIATQPMLVSSQNGQLLVHLHQVVPVVNPEPPPLINLTPLPNYSPHVPSLPHILPTSVNPLLPNVLPQLHQFPHNHKNEVIASHVIAKNHVIKPLKKKKVSPSAKRRSRLRLIAFLEAKKEKSAAQTQSEEQSCNKPLCQNSDIAIGKSEFTTEESDNSNSKSDHELSISATGETASEKGGELVNTS